MSDSYEESGIVLRTMYTYFSIFQTSEPEFFTIRLYFLHRVKREDADKRVSLDFESFLS